MTYLTLKFRTFFFLSCLTFAFSLVTRAELRTVTTLEDTNDAVCNSHCSLREAISAANSDDTIIFARQLRGGTINLQNILIITKSMKIDGPNRRRITLQGNGTFGIIRMLAVSPPYPEASIDGFIIRDGAALNGGGIYQTGGTALTISDCLITKNSASFGGGIRVVGGALIVLNSTISENRSSGVLGAAGFDAWLPGHLVMVNSTITGNVAENGPGGMRSVDENYGVFLHNTVSENVSLGSGFGNVGGLLTQFSVQLQIFNSIIAGNSGETPDVFLYSTSGANSFIGVGEGSLFVNGEGGMIVGTRKNPADPRFGSLTDNGRGLPTYAPLSTSRVINAGYPGLLEQYEYVNPMFSAAIDQRGFQRTVGKAIDMGSVEYGGAAVPLTTKITGRVTTATGRGVAGAFLTIRDAEGNVVRTPISNSSGYFNIAGLPADTQYRIEVSSKRHTFKEQTIMTEETTEYVDFVAN